MASAHQHTTDEARRLALIEREVVAAKERNQQKLVRPDQPAVFQFDNVQWDKLGTKSGSKVIDEFRKEQLGLAKLFTLSLRNALDAASGKRVEIDPKSVGTMVDDGRREGEVALQRDDQRAQGQPAVFQPHNVQWCEVGTTSGLSTLDQFRLEQLELAKESRSQLEAAIKAIEKASSKLSSVYLKSLFFGIGKE